MLRRRPLLEAAASWPHAHVAAHFAVVADVYALIHKDLQHNEAIMKEVYQVYSSDISIVHQDLEEQGEPDLVDIDSFGICSTPERVHQDPEERREPALGGIDRFGVSCMPETVLQDVMESFGTYCAPGNIH